MNSLSPRAQKLLDALSKSDQQVIQKENIFKKDRNRAICKLRERGVPGLVLAEVTGISASQIQRISLSERSRKNED
jgi:hypothetical protein